jgi:nicotinamidase-related amidase
MKALIVVDMQEDFVNGALGTPEAQAIVPNVVNKMMEYEGADSLVLFTKDTHYPDYSETQEGKKLPVQHCIQGTPGWSIVREIHNEFKKGNYSKYSSDGIVNSRLIKETFGSVELANLLVSFPVGTFDSIELCGVCTDICVISNAILVKTMLPEVPIIVDASCCAGVTPEKHAAALEVMKSCQIDVIGE